MSGPEKIKKFVDQARLLEMAVKNKDIRLIHDHAQAIILLGLVTVDINIIKEMGASPFISALAGSINNGRPLLTTVNL